MNLREKVSTLMIEVHQISPELAGYHVRQMDDEEVARRFQSYTGMELSAVGPKLRAGNAVSTRFCAPRR